MNGPVNTLVHRSRFGILWMVLKNIFLGRPMVVLTLTNPKARTIRCANCLTVFFERDD